MFRFVALTLIILSLGSVNAIAADRVFLGDPSGIPLAAKTDSHTARTLAALRQKAKKDGAVRLIIGVRAAFAPEESLDADGIRRQRSEIATEQDAVLNKVPSLKIKKGKFKRFGTIPFMAVEADPTELEALAKLPEITAIEEDKIASPTLAQSVPLIGAPPAWSGGYSGVGQTVAVLDNGVDSSHPFLANKVVSEACYSSNYPPDSASSICPGGVTQSTSPGSAMPYAGPCPKGECDHGTHVAGIAAGTGASFSGVAKDASLIAIQVFSRFDSTAICGATTPCTLSYTSDEILGLEQVYSLRNTYNIAAVNMSLGSGRYTDPSSCDADNIATKSAIDNLRAAGIATVVSSGNDGYLDSLSAPACISSAVSVGATWDTAGWLNNCAGYTLGSSSPNQIACYSNSAPFLDLLAPGSAISSSIPGGLYTVLHGTSMAAPHVAGTWAVLKQKKSSLAVNDALNALRSSGVSITDPRNNMVKPRIQVDAALDAVTSICNAALKPTSFAAGAALSFGTVTVTADAGCAWTAASNVGWITITAGASGTGNGAVSYYIDTNTAAAARTGTLTIAGLTFTVTQDGSTDTTPPTVPTGLIANAVSSSQINLSWTASTDAVGVTNYKVYRNGTQIAQVNVTHYNDTGLAPSTLYSYTVAACDAATNCSDQSANASATTLGSGTPDLILTALRTTTAAVAAGNNFSVSSTVNNQGSQGAGAFVIDFHLSINPVYGDSDDIVMTGTRALNGLADGAKNSASVKVSVPLSTSLGNYYLCAKADSGDNVSEGSNENNNTLCTTTQIVVSLPDLILTGIAPSVAAARQGASMKINDTVANLGIVRSASSKVGFRLSLNRIYGDADDIVVSTTQSVSSLPAGSSKPYSPTIRIPSNAPANSYYLCAEADATKLVVELDETNNTLCSTAQVTVPPADLILYSLGTSTSAVAPGQHFKISNTLKNQGGVKATAFLASFHLSNNTIYGDSDDIVLSGMRKITRMKAGTTKSGATKVTVPPTTPLGNYHLCAMVDSGNSVDEGVAEGNNTRCSTTQITLAYSDLVMTAVAPTVATVNQGAYMTVNSTLMNQGIVPSTSSKIGFRLSLNNVFGDADDIVIGTTQPVSSLGTGTSASYSTSLKVPSSTPANSYYLCAEADATKLMPESNEGNNTLCSSTRVTVPLPDLVVSALSITDTVSSPGAAIGVTNSLVNIGGSRSGSFIVAFHLSTNTVYGDGDDVISISTRKLSSLATGITKTASSTVRIPATIAAGTYYVCAQTDDADTVPELDETNNSICTGATLLIP